MSLYARGMTVREIQGHLAELYDAEVSPDLISRVTDAILDEVREWQNRPLDPVYPVIFFDALRVKIRDEGADPMVDIAGNAIPDEIWAWRESELAEKAHLRNFCLAQEFPKCMFAV